MLATYFIRPNYRGGGVAYDDKGLGCIVSPDCLLDLTSETMGMRLYLKIDDRSGGSMTGDGITFESIRAFHLQVALAEVDISIINYFMS